MSESTQIRWATRNDIPEILAMIRELATFEDALDLIKTTEASLADNLSFAPEFNGGLTKAFLLTVSTKSTSDTIPTSLSTEIYTEDASYERIAGMAVYYDKYSTWFAARGIYLDDLYIRPEFRRRGYATMLFQRLAQEVVKVSDGKGMLEWGCLKWNQNALDFYERMGAKQKWVGLKLLGDALQRLASGSGVT